MTDLLPATVRDQVSLARGVVERHLGRTLVAIHLFGSTLAGGLKPRSDIDLLVTVSAPLDEAVRQSLLRDLLDCSAPPSGSPTLRPLEVTVVAYREVVPWRYPARRELQFGEWLRRDLLQGVYEPAVLDPDLAILLRMAREHGIALVGPSAIALFKPVPADDFLKALADTVAQWNAPADWEGDERNVVLALARIWYSVATGRLAPKDVAAAWALGRLPAEHTPVLQSARAAYLGAEEEGPKAERDLRMVGFVRYVRSAIAAGIDLALLAPPDEDEDRFS